MKIAVLNNIFAPYERGGAERVVASQINSLRQAGHEVVLITTKPCRASALEDAPDFPIYRLNSHYFGLGGWPLFLRPAWQLANLLSLRKFWQLKKLLASLRPDLVISHNLMGLGFMTPLAIRQLRLPHEHWLHDIQLLHPSGLMIFGQEKAVDRWPAKIYQLITRYFFGSPEKVISPSRWLLGEHQKRGFFPHANAQIADFQPSSAARQRNLAKPARHFLFVGQVEKHKGIFQLISAFLKTPGNDKRLEIIGDGRKLAAARRLAGSDPRISFRGRLNQAEIKKAMAAADWLVVPSLCYENFPTVIKEAQASGLPVIAARIGGIPEMLQPGDQAYAPGDEAALQELLAS